MADKEARIRLTLDGASQTISDLSKVAGGFRGLLPVLDAIRKQAVGVSDAIVRIRPINFKEATDGAEAFRLQLTRMALQTGQSVDALTARFEKVGATIGISAPEVANLATQYGRLTYDARGATETISDLGKYAGNSGRSLEEVVDIGANLHNHLGVPLKDVSETLLRFEKIAHSTGVQGLGRGLFDSLRDLGGQLEKFNTSTDDARDRLAAFVGLAGKGLPHAQATEAAGATLGFLSGDALGLGRYLGHKIIHDGKVDDPGQVLNDIKRKVAQGGRERELRVLARYTSPAAAANLIGLSESAIQGAVGGYKGIKGALPYDLNAPLTPEQQARVALEVPDLNGTTKLDRTPAGKAEKARVDRENVERGIGRKFLPGRDAYEQGTSAQEKIILESALGAIGDTGTIGGYARDAAQGAIAAGADTAGNRPVEDATAGGGLNSSKQLLLDQLREQKETNRILRAQPGGKHDVERRKAHPQ